MPKITRLNDPANPYGKKKVPTGREQDKPKPQKAVAAAPAARKPTKPPVKRGLIADLNDKYGGGARKRAIDAAIEGNTGSKGRGRP